MTVACDSSTSVYLQWDGFKSSFLRKQNQPFFFLHTVSFSMLCELCQSHALAFLSGRVSNAMGSIFAADIDIIHGCIHITLYIIAPLYNSASTCQ